MFFHWRGGRDQLLAGLLPLKGAPRTHSAAHSAVASLMCHSVRGVIKFFGWTVSATLQPGRDNCASSSGTQGNTEDTSMTGESRLLGFDFGDWLMLVVGLALAGSLTLII
jgi:hypothetical protein